MYKAIVSDLDGTLLTSKSEIPEYSKNIIRGAVKKGIKFFIATGRHHMDTTYYKDDIGEEIYLITSNGARVHDPRGKLIYSTNIDKNIVEEILDSGIIDETHVNFYVDSGWLLFEKSKKLEEYIKNKKFKPEVIEKGKQKQFDIIKMFLFHSDTNKLEQIEEKLKDKYGDSLDVYLSHDTCLEINSPHATKGKAMEKVLGIEEIEIEKTIVFGDHLNDLDMLRKAGKGLLMGGAYKKLRKILPEYQIIGSCDDESVAKYIESNILNKQSEAVS